MEVLATVADSILSESEATSESTALLVKVLLLLSMDRVLPASPMEASTFCDTEVFLPSSSPSLILSLDTVLLLTSGEVWARPAARSMREEVEAIAASWDWPIEASDKDSPRLAEEDRSCLEVEFEAIWAELEAIWLELEAIWLELEAIWLELEAIWLELEAIWLELEAIWVALDAIWLELEAIWLALEAAISELLTALLLRLFSEEEKDFFWTDEEAAVMEEADSWAVIDDDMDAMCSAAAWTEVAVC